MNADPYSSQARDPVAPPAHGDLANPAEGVVVRRGADTTYPIPRGYRPKNMMPKPTPQLPGKAPLRVISAVFQGRF